MDEYSLIAAGYTVDDQAAGRTKASAPIIILIALALSALVATVVASIYERRDVRMVGIALFLCAAALAILLQPRLARCGACRGRMTRRALSAKDDGSSTGIIETRVFVCEACKRFFVIDRLGVVRTTDDERNAHQRAKRQQRTARREAGPHDKQ